MEPSMNKTKITGHFRVALKPQDINVQKVKKFKRTHDSENENRKVIEVITIKDDGDENQSILKENNNNNNIINNHHKHTRQSLVDTSSKGASSQATIVVERLPKKSVSPANKYFAPPGILPSIVDHDQRLLQDIRCEPYYAWDSFEYDKKQELRFQDKNYLDDGELDHEITPHKRAELVDWLVQMQNIFELDHEPLYMAVKLADQYLMRKFVSDEDLQLLYMTTILISAKFDERLPPLQISDLIQSARAKFGIKYTRKQIVSLEVDILTTLKFDIRYPLSYGFLRRFARCTQSDKKTLNLARYILESSLLEYDLIEVLESKMAAGSLLLAFQMLHIDGAWTETAKFYTGYDEKELYPISIQLNDMITRLSKKNSAIRRKYSHEYFMEVARIAPVKRLDR